MLCAQRGADLKLAHSEISSLQIQIEGQRALLDSQRAQLDAQNIELDAKNTHLETTQNQRLKIQVEVYDAEADAGVDCPSP